MLAGIGLLKCIALKIDITHFGLRVIKLLKVQFMR